MQTPERIDQALFNRRTLMCMFTGFSSGLPLYLLINLVPAWLRSKRVDLTEIGLMSLIQFPYIWKFLWSPLVDRFAIGRARWGRRRGWMAATQIALVLTIAALGFVDPQRNLGSVAVLAGIVALFSATQDIALDAYRRELLPDAELGFGNSVHITTYRVASFIPSSLALILADHLPWSSVFTITGLFMLPGLIATLFAPQESAVAAPATLTDAVIEPFREFLQRQGAWLALEMFAFLFLYKLGDNMATTLATPFYLDMGFTKTQIGEIAKMVQLWASLGGGLVGGLWMVKLGINRALWLFGLVQITSVLGYVWLAHVGHNTLWLAVAIGYEALGVGLGTAAFTAYIARATNPHHTATQFALFTSLAAVPRTVVTAGAGWLVEHMGWGHYFWLCFALGLPGMLLLLRVAPWNTADINAAAA